LKILWLEMNVSVRVKMIRNVAHNYTYSSSNNDRASGFSPSYATNLEFAGSARRAANAAEINFMMTEIFDDGNF
jgi:hypothetical protein